MSPQTRPSIEQTWRVQCANPTCDLAMAGFATDKRAVAYARAMGWHVVEPEGLGPTLAWCPEHAA